jgi:hypothetical protein
MTLQIQTPIANEHPFGRKTGSALVFCAPPVDQVATVSVF